MVMAAFSLAIYAMAYYVAVAAPWMKYAEKKPVAVTSSSMPAA